MNRFLSVIVCCLVTLAQPSWAVLSQTLPQKKEPIMLKLPMTSFGSKKLSRWSGKTTYRATVNRLANQVLVDGKANWQTDGWPMMQQLLVRSIKVSKLKTELEAELASKPYPAIAFVITFAAPATETPALIDAVIFIGSVARYEQSDYYHQSVMKIFLPPLFSRIGLTGIDEERQLAIVRATGYNLDGLRVEEYKSQRFLTFSAESENEYNSLQLGQSARAARIIQEALLDDLKTKFVLLKDVPIDGLRISVDIPYRDFVRESEVKIDNLMIYCTLENLGKFVAADITSQALIDASVILINGNRTAVNLGAGK
jgi:hypothetical protein